MKVMRSTKQNTKQTEAWNWANEVLIKQSPKNESVTNSELEATIVEQLFSTSIMLKSDWKSWTIGSELNLKLKMLHSWCSGSWEVEILKTLRMKRSKLFCEDGSWNEDV